MEFTIEFDRTKLTRDLRKMGYEGREIDVGARIWWGDNRVKVATGRRRISRRETIKDLRAQLPLDKLHAKVVRGTIYSEYLEEEIYKQTRKLLERELEKLGWEEAAGPLPAAQYFVKMYPDGIARRVAVLNNRGPGGTLYYEFMVG